jgi:AbrB family looped-hinge helix DNA binding protein
MVEKTKMVIYMGEAVEQIEVIKQVDEQGRIVIPKKWRDRNLKNSSTVVLEIKDSEIVLKSHQPVDITKHFNSLKVDLKSDLTNWDDVKRELLGKRP